MNHINKNFGKVPVLRDVTLQVEEGELFSLLGPSGCGKTTTLKIIAGLLDPDEGEVFLDGRNMAGVPTEKRGAVIVFQDHLLFPHLTVAENIGFGLKMAKLSKEQIASRVRAMISLVELEGFEKRYPAGLSGGQRQRVALARALATEPKVLLMDEPFSNLDERLKESVRELTLRLLKQLNITTILVTHDKEEAFMYSSRIAVMLEGRIVQTASPEMLYQYPVSLEAALFLGDATAVSGIVRNGRFLSPLLDLPVTLPDTCEAAALFRPEDVELYEMSSGNAVIRERKYAGDRIFYTLEYGGLVFRAASPRDFPLMPGDAAGFRIRTDHVLVYDRRPGGELNA